MIQVERHREIIKYLGIHGSGKVEELARLLDVSAMTIRRDLEQLETLNVVSRFFGGAVLKSAMGVEVPYKDKSSANSEHKKRIAWEAVKQIRDGQIIFLDSGTTTMEMAKLLKNYTSLTVVTSDIRIAGYLALNTQLEVYCTGGKVQNRTGACIGPSAVGFLRDVEVDVAFIGTSSINNELYLCTPSMEKSEIKRQMLKTSEKLILITDSSKFKTKSFVKVCHMREFSALITDTNIPEEIVRQIGKLPTKIYRV